MTELIFDIDVRRGGKTSRMIEWLKKAAPDERRVLVSVDYEHSHHLWREHMDDGDLEAWQFIDLAGLQSGLLRGMNPPPVLGIDNLDWMLSHLVGDFHHIGRISATGTKAP